MLLEVACPLPRISAGGSQPAVFLPCRRWSIVHRRPGGLLASEYHPATVRRVSLPSGSVLVAARARAAQQWAYQLLR